MRSLAILFGCLAITACDSSVSSDSGLDTGYLEIGADVPADDVGIAADAGGCRSTAECGNREACVDRLTPLDDCFMQGGAEPVGPGRCILDPDINVGCGCYFGGGGFSTVPEDGRVYYLCLDPPRPGDVGFPDLGVLVDSGIATDGALNDAASSDAEVGVD